MKLLPPVRYEVWSVEIVDNKLNKTSLVDKCRTKFGAERAKGYWDVDSIMKSNTTCHLIWDIVNGEYLI